MNTGRATCYDSSANDFPTNMNVDHNRQLRRVVYLPVETLQPVYIQPNDAVQEPSLPLYTRATSDNNFSRDLPIRSTAGNWYPFCSAPTNPSYNSDGCSYHHVSVGALSRTLRRRSFSPYHPQLISSHISNIIQTNLYGQELSDDGNSYSFGTITYSENKDVFATQNIEDVQMYPNTVFSSIHNTQSDDDQHRSNFLEHSNNTLSSGSTEESTVTSMINSQSLYLPDELPMDVAVENQSSSSHSASNSSSLGESQFGQFHSITEQYYQRPSSYLSTYPTQEIADIRLAVSPLHHCSGNNVVSNQVSFCSPSNSASVAENQFKKSCINEERYSPSSSSSVHANTVQAILTEASSVAPPSHHSSGTPLSSDSASKDNMHCFSTLYEEVARELYSASNGDVFNYINTPTPYAYNESTETSKAIQEAMMQPSSSVESTDKRSTELFCKFCYKNREPAFIFRSHQFKNEKGIVTCPVLRKYSCPVCGARGDFSHTVSYCPLAEKNNAKSKSFQEVRRSSELECISRNNSTLAHSSPKSTSTSESFPTSKDAIGQKLVIDQLPKSLKKDGGLSCVTSCTNKRKAKNQPQDVSYKLLCTNVAVACPFARSYLCEICGMTGDTVHTHKCCPENTYKDLI